MKRTIDTLYPSSNSQFDIDKLPKGELGTYLAEAKRVAQSVVDSESHPDGNRNEVDRALEILWHVDTLGWQIENGSAQGVAMEAIRLAQHVERFNVDRAFVDSVNVGARVIDGNPNRKPDYTDEVGQYKADHNVSVTQARKAVAKRHGVSVRTLINQANRRKR